MAKRSAELREEGEGREEENEPILSLTESLDEERDRDRALGRREEARDGRSEHGVFLEGSWWVEEREGRSREYERKEGIEPTRHGSSFGVQNLREGIILVSFVIGGLDID